MTRYKIFDPLAGKFFDPTIGWVLAAVIVVVLAVDLIVRRRRRIASGLPPNGLVGEVDKFAAISFVVLGATAVRAGDRGIPLAPMILLAFALLSVAADVKYMITGGVLLAAVTIDAVARQGRQRAGV